MLMQTLAATTYLAVGAQSQLTQTGYQPPLAAPDRIPITAPPVPPSPPPGGVILVAPAVPPRVAVAPPPPPPPPTPPVSDAPHSLRGSNVMVYNFLDFRANFFGPRVLEQVDRQLPTALQSRDIRTQVVWFNTTLVRRSYAVDNRVSEGKDRVPIGEVVIENLAREQAFGARYRLIVLPSNVIQSGAWQEYEVRWLLMDIASTRIIWTTVTNNRRMTLWRNDENSERRVQVMLERVLAELQAGNLV